jgi:hypothetical protein
VGRVRALQGRIFVVLLLALSGLVGAEEALEFQRLQSSYQSAVQRAERPLTQAYIQELSRLRDTYLAANRAAEAQKVETEIKLMTDKIVAMDNAAKAASQAAAPDLRTAPTTMESSEKRVVVSDARVKVPANSPDGYPLGALRKGDVVTLQYIEGLWKAHGHLATDNPDVVREERNHQDESRLVIARASSKGKAGSVIALVPPLTTKTPFTFRVPEDRSDLVLRIHKNSEDKGNPGEVTYQLKITR